MDPGGILGSSTLVSVNPSHMGGLAHIMEVDARPLKLREVFGERMGRGDGILRIPLARQHRAVVGEKGNRRGR